MVKLANWQNEQNDQNEIIFVDFPILPILPLETKNTVLVDLIRKNLRDISILKQIEMSEIRNFILKNELFTKIS